jgi:hypothetical protein
MDQSQWRFRLAPSLFVRAFTDSRRRQFGSERITGQARRSSLLAKSTCLKAIILFASSLAYDPNLNQASVPPFFALIHVNLNLICAQAFALEMIRHTFSRLKGPLPVLVFVSSVFDLTAVSSPTSDFALSFSPPHPFNR